MANQKFQYPELVRVEKNDVRYYQDSNDHLVPSVTTILSATGDKSGINAWKRRVGKKFAKQVVDEATTIGTAVHLAIENYLNDCEWKNFLDIVWYLILDKYRSFDYLPKLKMPE